MKEIYTVILEKVELTSYDTRHNKKLMFDYVDAYDYDDDDDDYDKEQAKADALQKIFDEWHLLHDVCGEHCENCENLDDAIEYARKNQSVSVYNYNRLRLEIVRPYIEKAPYDEEMKEFHDPIEGVGYIDDILKDS